MQVPASSNDGFDCGAVFSATPSPYLILDPDFLIVAVNNAYLYATRRSRDDLLGNYVFDAFPDNPSDPQASGVRNLHRSLQRVLQDRIADAMAIQKYDIPIGDPNEGRFEERHWTAVNTPVFDVQGKLTHIIHHVEDVTDQVRCSAALHQSESRIRALTIATADVVFRMNPDWTQMHTLDGRGFLKDSVAPGPFRLEDYVPPEDQELVRKAAEEAIRSKTILTLEHRVLRADGSRGWAYSRAVPLLDADHEIYEWIGAASDITERKASEAGIRANTERYQTLFNSIDEGFSLVELIFDAENHPIDYRFLEANPVFEAQTGLRAYPSRLRMREILA